MQRKTPAKVRSYLWRFPKMRNLSRLDTVGALVLVLSSVPSFGIPPCQPILTIVKPDFSVTVVLDKGVTISKAKVILNNGKGQIWAQATTDSQGVAKFSKLENGGYVVYVDLPRAAGTKFIRVDSAAAEAESSILLGYVTVPPLHLQQQPIKIWHSTSDIPDHPGARFFRPMANAEVSLRNLEDDREVEHTKTSESGVYTIPKLKRGLYTISVTSQPADYPWLFHLLLVADVEPSSSNQQLDISIPVPRIGQCNGIAYQIGAPDLQAQLK
jgi:hypothetical protein